MHDREPLPLTSAPLKIYHLADGNILQRTKFDSVKEAAQSVVDYLRESANPHPKIVLSQSKLIAMRAEAVLEESISSRKPHVVMPVDEIQRIIKVLRNGQIAELYAAIDRLEFLAEGQ